MPKTPQVAYEITDPSVPAGPNAGYLYMIKPHPKDNYIANSVRRTLATGIIIAVPDGITVNIKGLYENDVRGLDVIPQTLRGPVPAHQVFVVLANNAMATIALDPTTPIAQITATRSAPVVLWAERPSQHARAQEQQAALMGTREPPTGAGPEPSTVAPAAA